MADFVNSLNKTDYSICWDLLCSLQNFQLDDADQGPDNSDVCLTPRLLELVAA